MPPLINVMGQIWREMYALNLDISRLPGFGVVHQSVNVSSGLDEFRNKGWFGVGLSVNNGKGYDLTWSVEIVEVDGRYSVERSLYGSDQSERYRGGDHLFFELTEIEFDSQEKLCEHAVDLVREFRNALQQSLAHVPND